MDAHRLAELPAEAWMIPSDFLTKDVNLGWEPLKLKPTNGCQWTYTISNYIRYRSMYSVMVHHHIVIILFYFQRRSTFLFCCCLSGDSMNPVKFTQPVRIPSTTSFASRQRLPLRNPNSSWRAWRMCCGKARFLARSHIINNIHILYRKLV